jgi:hypothetical protein
MKSLIRRIIYSVIPDSLANLVVKLFSNPFADITYSHEGEDIVLLNLLGSKKRGFYVDVGAHHPFRFSNTYKFYRLGWSGINIDAMPGSMEVFRKYRKRDINVEFLIAKEPKNLVFYSFNKPALNTVNPNLAESRDGKDGYKIIKKYELESKTLREVLNLYLPKNIKIDFMSIDVESLDLEVLESNDWEKYLPEVIAVESLNTVDSLDSIKDSAIYQFLIHKGYTLYSKLANTLIFKINK